MYAGLSSANLATMLATSRHGTPSLTFHPRDGEVSYSGGSYGRSPIQFYTVHNHA